MGAALWHTWGESVTSHSSTTPQKQNHATTTRLGIVTNVVGVWQSEKCTGRCTCRLEHAYVTVLPTLWTICLPRPDGVVVAVVVGEVGGLLSVLRMYVCMLVLRLFVKSICRCSLVIFLSVCLSACCLF